MKKDIVSSVVNKGKKITGDDLGKLLLADMTEELRLLKNGKKPKSIISQDEFDKLYDSLPDDTHIKRYGKYVNLYSTIMIYRDLTVYALNSSRNRLTSFIDMITVITEKIKSLILKDNTPLILTENQYNDVLKKHEDDFYNYFDIFFNFMEEETLIKKNSKEEVKNKKLRDLYYKVNYFEGADSYFFKYGFFPEKETRKEFLYRLSIRNIKPIKERVEAYTDKDLERPLDKNFILDVLTKEQVDQNMVLKTRKKNVYKKDIMDKNLYIRTDHKDAKKEIIELYKLYADELPELVDLIKTRFKEYGCLKVFNDMNINDAFTTGVHWKDLVKDGVPDYSGWTLDKFREDYKRPVNGITILKEDIPDEYKRNYKLIKDNILDKISYKEVDEILSKIIDKNIQTSFYENLKMLNAYNTFIEIVADMLNLPKLKETFIIDETDIDDNAQIYNKNLEMLLITYLDCYALGGQHYNEVKKLKDNLLKALPYIDLSLAKVTDSNRTKAEKFIHDLNNFEDGIITKQPILILMGKTNG